MDLVGITGNALKEDQVEYMEAGLDRVLTKPVLERSLKEMLRIALARKRARSKPTSFSIGISVSEVQLLQTPAQ
jgi:DNA-binding response OmpR family regulator